MTAELTFGRAGALAVLLAAASGSGASANEALDQLDRQAAAPGALISPVTAAAENGPAAAAPKAPAVSAAGIDIPSLVDAVEDVPERLCYEAAQRYYFPNKDLVKFVNEVYRKYLDPLEGRCDLKQPLFNFHPLGPGAYRSAKPTPEGFAQLKAMGVKTVLSLAPDFPYQGATEAQTLAAKGLNFENIPVDYTQWPTNDELDRALAVLTDPAKLPADVHCTCGYDRTGIVAAAYRVVVQGWPVQKAADEAKSLGWHFPLCGDLVDFLNGYVRHRSGAAVGRGG